MITSYIVLRVDYYYLNLTKLTKTTLTKIYPITSSSNLEAYALAINATKETPFPTEPLIMALLLAQHKMISWLSRQVKPKHIISNKFGLESINS